MTTQKEITKLLADCLASEFDWCLATENFTRKPGSLQYARIVPDGTQFYEVYFHIRDLYASGSVADLQPQVSIVFPQLNQTMLNMMGELPTLENADATTTSSQIANIAPRDLWNLTTQWYVADHASARECVLSMRDVVQQWGIPFVNKYTTIAALIDGYEHHDERLRQDRRFFLFIVAAYSLLGQPTKSMEVLESKFGKAGSRRRYARAFEYVEKQLR